eukprot:8679700-Pyramimonas_sp.AAC.1
MCKQHGTELTGAGVGAEGGAVARSLSTAGRAEASVDDSGGRWQHVRAAVCLWVGQGSTSETADAVLQAEVYGALLNKAKYTAENRYEDGPFSSPVLVVADLSGRVITGGGHTSIRSAEFVKFGDIQSNEDNLSRNVLISRNDPLA